MTQAHDFSAIDMPQPLSKSEALVGRSQPMAVSQTHHEVLNSAFGDIPAGHDVIYLGMGCFWGAERLFWQQPNVHCTSVGYAGGVTPNPTYEEVCTGKTGHAEVVQVIYRDEPEVLLQILTAFWESHDPTQGMRQGNDLGTQYRSMILCTSDAQKSQVQASRLLYQKQLELADKNSITTQVVDMGVYYWAETYHQQYLSKNPQGYCGLGGTGVCLMPE